jgi:cytoskeletal protein RodZ
MPTNVWETPPLMSYPTSLPPMAESIGQQLQQARQGRSLTLDQVARATHLRVHYLQSLESGDLSAIPSLAQARGFLRIYADYLGLDARSLLGELEQYAPPAAEAAPLEQPLVTPAASAAATEVFGEIGLKLHKQREVLGLSLEDVERYTHLRTFYLKALEAGDFDGLPSPVQGRGMLSNYAGFLGMDPEPLLLKYAEGLQRRLAVRQAAQKQKQTTQPRSDGRPKKPPSSLQRFFTTELLLGASLVILLGGFVLWAAIRVFALRSQEQPAPTAPSIAAVLLATSTATQPASPVPVTPTIPLPAPAEAQPTEGATQAALPPPASGASVQVYVTVRQRAWMRVIVDGEIEFEGRVVPGSAYQFTGEDKVEILTGNGAALQVFFNQNDLGLLGLLGEVVHQVYTLQGVETPTPTITMTPTATGRPTRTPLGTPQGTPAP